MAEKESKSPQKAKTKAPAKKSKAADVASVPVSYCIIETGGRQARVSLNQTLKVPTIQGEVGSTIQIDKVLLYSDGKDIKIGSPSIEGAKVDAKILSHGKGKKVIVFKMKRRKKYRRRNGHRQAYTEIQITGIKA